MTKKFKKLVKSPNRMIFGVCGGVGDFLNIDPTIVRLIWILITIFTNFLPGVIIYIIASVIIPETSTAQHAQAD